MKNKSRVLIIAIFLLIGLAKGVDAQWQQTSLDSTYVYTLALNGNDMLAGTIGFGVYQSTNKGNS